ncbi:MAG: HNH endonuclease, partial [Gemmatimonadales bacterium]
ACSSCNTRKGNHLPAEINMHPLTVPTEPHFVHLSWAIRRLSPAQQKYILMFYGEEALAAIRPRA